MIPSIYSKWYYRLLTGLLIGLMAWLLIEVLLNIRYRYFELFTQPLNYLYAGVFGVVIMELTVRMNTLLGQKFSWQKSPARRWLVQSVAGIFIAFIFISLIRNLVNLLFSPDKLIIITDEVIIMLVPVVIIISFNLIELGYFLNERYHRSLSEMERFRKENAEYQFEMLKLQLNPHFLFNSLNTLSSLVYEDAGKASDFIRKLSEVYRYVLDNRNRELITLREELEFIRSFTFLLELRFQGMIDFSYEIGEQTFDRRLAPMTLQLLIENAVRHNVVSLKKPLKVMISTVEDYMTVKNNLQPKEENPGTGLGLKNIVSRYAFLTSREVKITKEDHQFIVKIPLI